MMERALLGAVAAALITAFARRLRLLDESGQWAAFACGIVTAAAGWPWAALLVTFFVSASIVTMFRAARKAERTLRYLPQVSVRNGMQVLSNGGLFALLAVLALRAGGAPASAWGIAAAGALAAASADTWATEIGTLWGGRPRSIVTWRRTEPGLSGGVSLPGTLGAVAGAALIAAAAATVHGIPIGTAGGPFVRTVAIAGVVGCVADSVIGATVQARRWCDHCKEWTERRVHPCGYRTVHAAGSRWISNDVVNAAATVAGATAAVLLQAVTG